MIDINQFNFKKPLLALAPMDGVTDAAFRFITKKYGDPDLIFTEFTHVHGLCVAGDKLLHHFFYDEIERPIIAQIYGKEPEYFYHATKIVCALGFDGVDINMGCPAKTVSASGAGAGLIRTPELASEIIRQTKKAVEDWVLDGELTGLSKRTYDHLKIQISKQKQLAESNDRVINSIGLQNLLTNTGKRMPIPVTVKTRIGYDVPITKKWIEHLNKSSPVWISLHGRTLKQMYTGRADWTEIAKAVEVSKVPILANGDIKSIDDAKSVLNLSKASGILIGRATFGNPFIFKEIRKSLIDNLTLIPEFSKELKFQLMLEHTKKFIETYPDPKAFFQMRKHYGWYASGFDGAVELRKSLMQVNNLEELSLLLDNFI
jgi:tRNA-dihydrouridine synthase